MSKREIRYAANVVAPDFASGPRARGPTTGSPESFTTPNIIEHALYIMSGPTCYFWLCPTKIAQQGCTFVPRPRLFSLYGPTFRTRATYKGHHCSRIYLQSEHIQCSVHCARSRVLAPLFCRSSGVETVLERRCMFLLSGYECFPPTHREFPVFSMSVRVRAC